MASLTIRKLDEALKQQLRLRAAANGRSVEDEVRTILRASATVEPTQGIASRSLDADPARDRETRPKRVLLIIGGGIAAYKSLDLIRRLRERGYDTRVVMTKAAQQFVTPLSVGAVAGEHAHLDLFDPATEFDVGHIRLARDCDLIVVAPATADLMAKLAQGHADDLATAVLLATDRPILLAPAMNPLMWANAATRRNVAQLRADGIALIGPNAGEMAEAREAGIGRMAEPLEIVAAVTTRLTPRAQPLTGTHVIVTSGPTHEPIDPVRYIANRSSGKQGHAIAAAAAQAGAKVTLISGPVTIPDPPHMTIIRVESAREMRDAVERALPADVAIFAAAVADWRVASAGVQKIKKGIAGAPQLALVENPDILATVAQRINGRPQLVIGFAAETENVVANAQAKLARKHCDWIVANDVSAESGVMGGDSNTVHVVTNDAVDSWPPASKDEVARRLIARIADALAAQEE